MGKGSDVRMKARVFFDARRTRNEAVVMVRLEDQTVYVERGVGIAMREGRVTSRRHATAADASKAFEAECKKLGTREWWEIGVEIHPRVGEKLPAHVRRALFMSEAAALETTGPLKRTERETAAPKDRSSWLTEVVSSGKRVRAKEELVLPTGKLVAYDPMLIATADRSLPFETTLPPGRYPVVLSIRDGVVAAASVRVAEGTVERWELALPRGMKRLVSAKYRVPSDNPGYTFPVDSATSCFVDASALESFDDERLVTRLLQERAMNRCHPLPNTDATVAVFRSANRDGAYASYFGMRGKKIVCVTTDFGV
jgi:hypothetical protein